MPSKMPMRCVGIFCYSEMKIDECFRLGYIQKAHALKGQVTAIIDVDAPIDIDNLKTLFLEKGNVLVPYFIENLSSNAQKAIIKFEDVDNIDQAGYLVGSSIYLPKTERPKSVKGEFYDDEVIGFVVTDTELGLIGDVAEIVQAGPNKLLSVKGVKGEVLIPVNSPFIRSINKAKRTVTTLLPDGYLDI